MEDRRKDWQDMVERIAVVETQMKRFASDAESEKDTRRRANASIFEKIDNVTDRIRSLEIRIWIATGSVSTLIFLLDFLFKGK